MTEAPKPLFVLISLIALAFMAATAYVAVQASMESSTIPGAAAATHAPA
ncbi:MAG TPA: hypothetical protein VG942_17750 [Hyphomonadaceae bacterium]|nr:hypothetical protein [Hyphomonadaceae bacterium]